MPNEYYAQSPGIGYGPDYAEADKNTRLSWVVFALSIMGGVWLFSSLFRAAYYSEWDPPDLLDQQVLWEHAWERELEHRKPYTSRRTKK